jgi:hypothetical protein
VQQEELHALQWENRTRVQEVQELQKVSDAKPLCGCVTHPSLHGTNHD